MKALEILKEEKKKAMIELSSNKELGISSVGVLMRLEKYDKAIAELEALQVPKTCDGCKYEAFNNDVDKLIICVKCTRLWDDNYKPKETQC